jgi:hypothetical protein
MRRVQDRFGHVAITRSVRCLQLAPKDANGHLS